LRSALEDKSDGAGPAAEALSSLGAAKAKVPCEKDSSKTAIKTSRDPRPPAYPFPRIELINERIFFKKIRAISIISKKITIILRPFFP
jgi:hypothetical protein